MNPSVSKSSPHFVEDGVHLPLEEGKKVYFASDFHLGVDALDSSQERERKIVLWLKEIRKDAAYVFLVGDIFDFWFDYNYAIPKGFVRFQAAVAELTDNGIPVYFFIGNHDMWMFGYHQEELGIQLIRKPVQITIGHHRFFIGHGDGLGPGDHTYKVLKQVFANKICQFLFNWIHPNIGMWIADTWSQQSKKSSKGRFEYFKGEKEWIWQYCREIHPKTKCDYYLLGHRHLPLELPVEDALYINIGEWMGYYYTFGVYDGTSVDLYSWMKEGAGGAVKYDPTPHQVANEG